MTDGERETTGKNAAVKSPGTLGYEECRDELIEVVHRLEQGGLTLDESLKLWEKGEQLAKRCEEHLAGARKRVEDALADDEEDADAEDR